MRDKRPVDELSIEELERILAVRKREERQKRMEKLKQQGRVLDTPAAAVVSMPASPAQPAPVPAGSFPPPPVPFGSGAVQFEDELNMPATPEQAAAERAWKRFVNGLLTVVEIAAVVGLIAIGLNLVGAIGTLERETASAASAADAARRAGIPTIAPTPQITLEAVVLPGGHVFTESGAPQFNYSEIPSHLLAVVQDQIVAPPPRRPEPTDQTPLRLIVPRLDIDNTIVQGVDWEALKQGIGQVQNGITPGDESGNVVFAAHNDIYGEIFRHLDQLQPGDQIQMQTRSRVFNYTVTGWEVVDPSAVEVMANRNGATATLISCYPYGINDKRIVVYAVRDTV